MGWRENIQLIMIRIIFSILTFFLFIRCNSGVNSISNIEYEKLKGNHILIDVRSIDEHVLGNIPGSINIDYNSKKFESEIFAFDKDQKIILYCKTNNRSSKAASFLSQNGYSNIFILEEGFKGWFLDQKIKK
tara:strand:- start:508 stop:903 length:396 start_codon:yes stop_codon:yes gene_type:complete